MNSYLPFTLFGDLSRNFDSRGEPAEKARRAWAPAVDISEADDAYLLSMDVPGISREAIEVSVDGGVLTVKGERTIDYADTKLAVNERWQGEFVRRFSLPDTVDQEKIAAKVENGVLALHIPKLAAAEPRRITVQ
jgi:HSP20 family protein